jgi:hypothetical protein
MALLTFPRPVIIQSPDPTQLAPIAEEPVSDRVAKVIARSAVARDKRGR